MLELIVPQKLLLSAEKNGVLDMKKILFVTTSDLSGSSGHNVATKEMVAAFARNKTLDVSVVCPSPLDNLPQKIAENVYDFHHVIPRVDDSITIHFKTQLSMFSKIGQVLRREEFDLMVVRHAPVMIAPTVLSKVFGIPYVLLARGLSHERLRFSRVLKKIFWVNVRLAEDVYCAYSEVVERAENIRPSSKSSPVLFPNAVDPTEFTQYEQQEARECTPYSFTNTDFVIGFVGSLKPYHMIKELIQAADRLPENVHLLIVGDGPEREPLERFTRDLELSNQITFTGFIEHNQVDKYISACDVMYGVIDPNHPGNAIKCYEYLACNRPIITDRRSEFEFVDEIGAGITLDEVTVDQIVAAIGEFKSMSPEERLDMGKQGREYVLENHTWDALVDLVIERNL